MQTKTLFVVGTLVLAVYCFYDAKKQGRSLTYAYIISILIIFFPMFALPFYFLTRNTKFAAFTTQNFTQKTHQKTQRELAQTKLCPKCGHDNPNSLTECEKCQNKLNL